MAERGRPRLVTADARQREYNRKALAKRTKLASFTKELPVILRTLRSLDISKDEALDLIERLLEATTC